MPLSPPYRGRSQTSSPSNNHGYYPPRLYKSKDHTPQTLPPLTYSHHSSSTLSTTCESACITFGSYALTEADRGVFSAPPSCDMSSRATGVIPAQSSTKTARQCAFEEYSSSADRRHDWRRDSSESVASTPSLVGSFTSSCSSTDGTSPALTPTTPPDSESLWDLGGKEYLLSHVPESDMWSKPFLHNPFSSRIPRRNNMYNARSPRLGSQQPPYKVQKKERAKPKNNGQAHCNEKYTTEEDRFLIYFRVDHTMTWQQLETIYNERFTYGSRPYRTDGGLQSQFYRLNKVCPVLTEDKLLVFGPTNAAEKLMNYYNEYDNLTWDCKQRQGKPASLVDRYAEQIVAENWSWISEEDMAEARRLGKS